MTDKPMLNLGCGTVILPCERPWHHSLVDEALYTAENWRNVDRNLTPGVDEQVDVFTYPWPWADNSFSGALLSHLVEHVPHEIHTHYIGAYEFMGRLPYWDGKVPEWRERSANLEKLQDGWFAFFSELWRVLEPGAVAHILVPHGNSDGARGDPTHTRYVMPHTFDYFMPDEKSSFEYAIGSKWRYAAPTVYRLTEYFQHLAPTEADSQEERDLKTAQLTAAMVVQINVAYEMYVRLEAVKDADHD